MNELENLLSQGLEAGYAGGTERSRVQRGPFEFEMSEFTSAEGEVYRDEWIADRTGGGQEVAEINGKKVTRLYAGGTISIERLNELGLTKKDVTGYLKRKIKELGPQTRLQEDCQPEPDGDWQYQYRRIDDLPEIPLAVRMETISFRGNLVFAHAFLHTTIE